jgi:hypothetical protein
MILKLSALQSNRGKYTNALVTQYDHPAGTTPFLAPNGTPDLEGLERRTQWMKWISDPEATRDESFHEATGKVGDVYFLHPLMLHSASRNLLRTVRVITNPPVAVKEPFNFNRSDPKEYSLVEKKILRDLGRPEGLPEWKITAPRALLTPRRLKVRFRICLASLLFYASV